MAEPLSGAAPKNVTKADALEFLLEYQAAEDAISEAASVKSAAISARKRLRKKMETAGVTLSVFYQVRADLEKSSDVLAREEEERTRLRGFYGKPVGFQPTMDLKPDATREVKALNTLELKRIDKDGFDSGFAGGDREENPHPVSTEAWQRWDVAFARGVSSKEIEGGGPDAPPPTTRRRRAAPQAEATA